METPRDPKDPRDPRDPKGQRENPRGTPGRETPSGPRETTGGTPGASPRTTPPPSGANRPSPPPQGSIGTPPPRKPLHVHEHNDARHTKRVSWPAIFAGTLVMLVVLMLLSLLGMGIGLTSFNPMEEVRPWEGLGTGALIWWVVSNLIAIFAGAFTAAQLTTMNYQWAGIYHGILSWSLYTLISFWLLTTAVAGVISGVGSMITQSLGVVGQGVTQMIEGQDVDDSQLNRMIQDILTQEERRAQQEFDIDVMAVIRDVFIVNGQVQTDVQREDVVEAVARHSTLSRQDAERAADRIMMEYDRMQRRWQEVQAEAERVAQEASDAAGRAAIWAFFALVIGLAVAAVAGYIGEPKWGELQEREIVV